MNAAKVYLVEWLIEDDDSPFFVSKGKIHMHQEERRAGAVAQTELLCICCYMWYESKFSQCNGGEILIGVGSIGVT